MSRRLFLALLLGAAALVAGPACTTPVIPIPPPEPEQMVFELDEMAQMATYQGDAFEKYAMARVLVFNETRGEGVITTANLDGSVSETAPFPAQAGDRILVSYELGEDSVSTCILLRNGRLGEADKCP